MKLPVTRRAAYLALALLAGCLAARGHAAVGDPQLRTEHPWYPGELAVAHD